VLKAPVVGDIRAVYRLQRLLTEGVVVNLEGYARRALYCL
jgi:hypothetical protein